MIGALRDPSKHFRQEAPDIRFRIVLLLAVLAVSCTEEPPAPESAPPPAGFDATTERLRMVEEQVKPMRVRSPLVLRAMETVPRHLFLPEGLWGEAYADRAVRRPDGETLTAPDLSAAMLEALELESDSKVLECGTRSGWLTALLAAVTDRVHTVDARPGAIAAAKAVHERIGTKGILYRTGDPLAGWAEAGPFDAIVVNGVVRHIPVALYGMLVRGGRILAPVGRPGERQTLVLSIRGDEEPLLTKAVLTVRFGPLAALE